MNLICTFLEFALSLFICFISLTKSIFMLLVLTQARIKMVIDKDNHIPTPYPITQCSLQVLHSPLGKAQIHNMAHGCLFIFLVLFLTFHTWKFELIDIIMVPSYIIISPHFLPLKLNSFLSVAVSYS